MTAEPIKRPVGPTAMGRRDSDICDLVVRQGIPMKAVADMYGMSRERVRQIVRQSHPNADLQHRPKKRRGQAAAEIRARRAASLERLRMEGPTASAPEVVIRYTDEEMLQGLRDHADRTGRNPTSLTWEGKPSALTYSKRFGSWTEALIAAGLRPPELPRRAGGPPPRFTDEQIVQTLVRFLGSDRDVVSPTGQYGAQHYSVWRAGDRNLPSRSLILMRFKKWSLAMAAARAAYADGTDSPDAAGRIEERDKEDEGSDG